MATRHLIPHLDLPLLGHIDPHHHVGTGGQFIPLFPRKDPHIHNAAFFAVGNPQGIVPHIPRLFAEDRPQQFFFRGLVGFPFRGHFPDENISGFHPSPDPDNAALV